MIPDRPARPASYFEFNAQYAAAASSGGLSPGWRLASSEHIWTVRAQDFAVSVSWLSEGQTLSQSGIPDEMAILIADACSINISSNSAGSVDVLGPAFVVVPPGDSMVSGKEPGFVTRVCTSRANDVILQARNHSAYLSADPAVADLPDSPPRANRGGIRVYDVADHDDHPGRFERLFRTDSLVISWLEVPAESRDVSQLKLHSPASFEKVSVTLNGDFVHHVRSPWTERLSDWRADDHVLVTSPSVTVIPAGNTHATRPVGEGHHQLIDVFAPPRQDFIDHGWIINQSDYES